ncbi:MAG TPA: hypothetical protein VFI14_03940 [Chryseosolibacter sp.]|nr:hypothetical protein [Chryseosolibacter sp.]
MKPQPAFCLAFIALVWCSCEFSAGTKKDLRTGLSVSNKGFSFDDSYLVGPDNTRKADNKVPLNSTVAIVVQGIDHYVLKDGKAFPGLMLTVTDKDGKPVLDEQDLLAEYDGVAPTDAAVLRGTVTVGNPMQSGETYHVKMRVWDKNKFENEINAEVDIDVL